MELISKFHGQLPVVATRREQGNLRRVLVGRLPLNAGQYLRKRCARQLFQFSFVGNGVIGEADNLAPLILCSIQHFLERVLARAEIGVELRVKLDPFASARPRNLPFELGWSWRTTTTRDDKTQHDEACCSLSHSEAP